MGQTEIAKLEVMPVSLAISRDVYQIPKPRRAHKPFHEATTRRQRSLERNRTREWSIVEKHRQRSSGSINMPKQIRLRHINLPLSLIRSKDHITHPLLYQQREYLVVSGSFRQPQRFRIATETKAKVREAPE